MHAKIAYRTTNIKFHIVHWKDHHHLWRQQSLYGQSLPLATVILNSGNYFYQIRRDWRCHCLLARSSELRLFCRKGWKVGGKEGNTLSFTVKLWKISVDLIFSRIKILLPEQFWQTQAFTNLHGLFLQGWSLLFKQSERFLTWRAIIARIHATARKKLCSVLFAQ